MLVERAKNINMSKKSARDCAVQVAGEMGIKVASSAYIGGGSFGRVCRITSAGGEKFAVKFIAADDMLQKETHDLELLARHCPVTMPQVIAVRPPDGRVPVGCYVMKYIEGKSALMSLKLLLKSREKRLDFAAQVTQALHAIHSCKSRMFGDTLSPDCADWLIYYKPFAAQVMQKAEDMHASGQLSDKIIRAMRAAWEGFYQIFSGGFGEACLIHGDLNIANIMVDKRGNLCGFIDPLKSMYADREYDLFQFDNLTGKRFELRQTYMRQYGASPKCDARCAFYGLWNEVYCYIKSGVLVGLIINPLIDNMYKRLAEL